jgi:hypothetical protein
VTHRGGAPRFAGLPLIQTSPWFLNLGGGSGHRDEAQLFQHRELVEHQVERQMLAFAEAEHLDIISNASRVVIVI